MHDSHLAVKYCLVSAAKYSLEMHLSPLSPFVCKGLIFISTILHFIFIVKTRKQGGKHLWILINNIKIFDRNKLETYYISISLFPAFHLLLTHITYAWMWVYCIYGCLYFKKYYDLRYVKGRTEMEC